MVTISPGIVRDLDEKAMVSRLNISKFNNSKLDKQISRETNKSLGAEEDSGHYYKPYFRRKDPVMKKVTREFGFLERLHKDRTLPYDNNGGRLMDTLIYYDFGRMLYAQIELCKDIYLNEFIPAIPRLTQDAKENHLGSKVFKMHEYPTQDELREKFIISHKFEVVSSGSQAYRLLGLSDDDKERIATEIDKQVEERLKAGMNDPWKRLHEVVKRIVDTLSDPVKGFHKTMITNAVDLVNVMPALNIAQDPNLDDMTDAVRDRLCSFDISDLKTDKYYREDAAKDAQKILDDMGAFFTP